LINNTLYKPYVAPSWLPGGNAQTIYPFMLRSLIIPAYQRERLELDDGDFIDIDWLDNSIDRPLVIMFHGLEGGSSSHYARSIMGLFQELGWRGAVVHFRGCSGTPNRLPRAYHAGDSEEIDRILHKVRERNQSLGSSAPLYVIGISLGGNALLKWLGEQGKKACHIIDGAVTVSVPLDLVAAGKALDSGFNRLYTQHFLGTLKKKVLKKLDDFPGLFDAVAVAECTTLYQFDNLVTAPLHGFSNTDEYWALSSSKPWLKHIQVPTLVINARNDPFMPSSSLPAQTDVSCSVSLEFPAEGGHVGFLSSPFPGNLTWLPERVIRFFDNQCKPYK
jgi:predicted alpha/beta-fold hydrolase